MCVLLAKVDELEAQLSEKPMHEWKKVIVERDQLQAALRGLVAEVSGFIGAFGDEIRPIVSTTNLMVLAHHNDKARELLKDD